MSRKRTAGFRFSVVDGCAIAICAGGVYGLWDILGTFVWILPFALGHFFLFCNIFRVRRGYELVWAALFLINFGVWFMTGRFSWPMVLAIQTPITLIAIGAEMRSPQYHGIFSRALNPNLDTWLHPTEQPLP